MLHRIILWGLLFVFLISRAKTQDLSLIVQDQVDLSYIDEVEIVGKNVDGEILFTGKTDKKGSLLLDEKLSRELQELEVFHEGYKKQEVAFEIVKAQQYRIYLENKTFNFNEIVFTANRYQENKDDIPYQIDVVKAQDIRFNNPQNSADLLQQKGSVFVQKSQMGGGSPNLRGFEANKILVVLDGIRINNAIFRSGHLQNVITIDPSIIDRTEVMFGPGSVMYGSDALGGVMHFYTRNPELSSTSTPLIKTNVASRYSSANREKYLHADLSFGNQNWGMLTSVSATAFNDLRTGNNRRKEYPDFGKREWYVERVGGRDSLFANDDVDFMRPTAYKQLDILQKFLFLPSSTLSHKVNFQYSTSTDIPRFDRLVEWRNGNPRYAEWNYGPQNRLLASYQLKHTRKNKYYDQLSFIAGFQDIDESRINRNFRSDSRNVREENVKVFSINLDLNKVVREEHELAYGLEGVLNDVTSIAYTENIVSHEKGSLNTRYPDGGNSMNSVAAYFTHRWEVNDKVTLTDGIRYTFVSLHSRFEDMSFFPFPFAEIKQNNGALSGNLAAVLKPAEGWRISLLGATGFRAPNLDDVTKVFDSQPGNVVVPNPNLKPEYSYNGELSISKTFGDLLRIELTGFYTWYTEALVVRNFNLNGEQFVVYDDSLSQVQANVNAGTAFITGINSNFFLEWGKWSLLNSITYTYGQETETDVPLDHIPPFFGKSEVSYKTKRFQAALYAMYNGWKRPERYSPTDDNNAQFATQEGWPSWWTLNLKTSLALSPKLKVQAGIENLFDLHYRPYSSRISAPGHNVFVSLRASL